MNTTLNAISIELRFRKNTPFTRHGPFIADISLFIFGRQFQLGDRKFPTKKLEIDGKMCIQVLLCRVQSRIN